MKKKVTECISWRWHGNLGDEMIFAAQQAMFGAHLDLGQYVEMPEAVLIGGGTFVPKRPENPELVQLSSRFPTAFFGTGIGDPLFWGTDHIPDWLKILKNAAFIGVRGPLSQERLQDWGVSGERVEWIGDPALVFADSERHPRPIRGELAVNLGTTYGQLYGFDEPGLERVVIESLRHLTRAGWRISLVSAWQPDDEILERIRASVPSASVEHWHDDFAAALESIGRFDLVISQKLHVGVTAACRNVPFLALNYRSKVLDFGRSIGWEDYCVPIDNLTVDRIVERVSTMAQDHVQCAARLHRGVMAGKQRLLRAVPRVLVALAGA